MRCSIPRTESVKRNCREPISCVLAVLVLFASAIVWACGTKNLEKRYELEGEIVAVDSKGRKLNIAHKEIPGYMPAMTMPFNLKESWALQAAVPGARVTATLVVSGSRSWLEDVVIVHSEPDNTVEGENVRRLAPKVGDEVPDFELTDQDGNPIRLSRYRGKALVLTFIYTRCPLPDYCPVMTRNFADIERALEAMPRLHEKTRLLTVTIDPEYDRPAVLREYGLKQGARFDHWIFAGGTVSQTKAVAEFFGVQSLPGNDQIDHSLVTAIIGPDSKLLKIYTGNDWKTADVLADLEALKVE